MKKHILVSMLTFSLLFPLTFDANVANAKSSSDFTDLKDLDPDTKAKFDVMIGTGIFDGVSASSFGISDNMNRAELAKVAALILGLDVDTDSKTSSFTDVKADDPATGYALPYIEALKRAGITEGYGNGTYNPEGSVTRQEFATILVRMVGMEDEVKSNPSSGGSKASTDHSISPWAKGYVDLALELKLLGIEADGTFGGKEDAKRDLLVTGSFETAKTLEEEKGVEISGADFVAGNKLNLTISVSVDADSIDLSNIIINGIALDPALDSFELSEDKKTIIIKLRQGFILDTTKTPVITVKGISSVYGNKVESSESKPIPVEITEAPMAPIIETTPEPSNNNSNTPNPNTPNPNTPNPNTPNQ